MRDVSLALLVGGRYGFGGGGINSVLVAGRIGAVAVAEAAVAAGGAVSSGGADDCCVELLFPPISSSVSAAAV